MEKLKALQDELAHIDATAHNLADPQAAVNAKQREIINELIAIVVGLAPASSVDHVQDPDETENTARPSLQAVADAVLELGDRVEKLEAAGVDMETMTNLDTRVAAIEQHPALSIPALDAPATAAAPGPAPEPTQTTTASADSAAQSGAAVSEEAAKS